MADIKRLVLDVLKPHTPSMIELARQLGKAHGVSGVNCTLDEVDQATETIKITIEGQAIDFDGVKKIIDECGAVIHSIDSVSSGKKLVDAVKTPQDD